MFFAVTAFDFGNPAVSLDPSESSPMASAEEVWPINSAEVVNSERPKPGVYPNPYRIFDDYNAAGWENPRGLEPDPERARKVTFYQRARYLYGFHLVIDGDLVRRLEHLAHIRRAPTPRLCVWNLITRNTQAVKTGIYIWSSRVGSAPTWGSW